MKLGRWTVDNIKVHGGFLDFTDVSADFSAPFADDITAKFTVTGSLQNLMDLHGHLANADKLASRYHREVQQERARKTRGRTIAIDFDGPIHNMDDGFREGELYGMAVPGAFKSMFKLIEAGYDIVIHTTRGSDPELKQAVETWIHDMQEITGYVFPFMVTSEKIPAISYIDDRAIRFTNWEDIRKLYC